jgi:hypothetical protein
MREYEKPIFEEFEKYANVVETWPLYDSIVVCEQLYGSEASIPGWFTTFAAFGARETHVFFKNRTDGTAGEPYTNHKNADTMDFAFKIHSFGVEVAGAPGYDAQSPPDGGTQASQDFVVPQWWRADFPRHCGIQLKVQQDIRVELPVLACPPGYGAMGSGYGGTYLNALGAFAEIPYMTGNATSGVPLLANRYPLPEPIGVPRTGSVEAVLHVSEWARTILQSITGPHQMVINSNDGAAPYVFAWSRYLIRVSLFGERLVQQRAQYHR